MRACLPGFLLIVFVAFTSSGCGIEGGDNQPRVPDQGLFIYAEANRHEADATAEAVAAVFDDGEPVNLVGGDVIEARTGTERVLLTRAGFFDGSYAESLPVDNSVVDVFFDIVHEPLEARANRWYPVDILNIDPGPGELVGKSSKVSFPQPVVIVSPVADTVYSSITDAVDLQWIAGVGDRMRVLAAVECTDGLATSSYGVVVDEEVETGMDLDDGSQTVGMDRFIYDLNLGSSTIKFVSDAALVLLQNLLNKLSAGNIDPDFLLKKREANPINSNCEIRLFLQRQLKGQFDVAFDDGSVFGSTSAEVIIYYQPAVPVN